MSRKGSSALVALAALLGAFSLAACHTVEGAGRDIQSAGDHIEDTARQTHDGNPNTP